MKIVCPDCGKVRLIPPSSSKTGYCAKCFSKHFTPKGKYHNRWKGGRTICDGYVFITLERNDPFYCMTYKGGQVLEHRYVMAKVLGRPLESWEFVHHFNGVRSDNRPENLRMTTKYRHFDEDRKLIEALQTRVTQLEAEMVLLRIQIRQEV